MTARESLIDYIDSGEEKLAKIVEKYPNSVPAFVIADFIGVDIESVRAWVSTGQCPFGVSWRKIGNGNSQTRIVTLPFVKFALYHRLDNGELNIVDEGSPMYKIQGKTHVV